MAEDPAATVRLALEVRRCGTTLAGKLYDESGTEHPFAGWLGLMTVLEASAAPPAPGAQQPPPARA